MHNNNWPTLPFNADEKLECSIVDDEPGAAEVLAADLRQLPGIGGVQTYPNYSDALDQLLISPCHLLFLDVEMRGMNGLDFLRTLQARGPLPFRVVFYTAHSNYLIDAVRNMAFDFLLKPYKKTELQTIIDRARRTPHILPAHPLSGLGNTLPGGRFAVQTICELLLLSLEDVFCFSPPVFCRHWEVRLVDGTVHQLHKSISAQYLCNLHPHFVRINLNMIINLTFLAAVENTSLRCRFYPPYEQEDAVVSRRYFRGLKERLNLL